jgi:hypothetical protein
MPLGERARAGFPIAQHHGELGQTVKMGSENLLKFALRKRLIFRT